MRIAYFDCFAGASGDMLLGTLLDAGLSLETLRGALASLPISGYRIEATQEARGALQGTHVRVVVDAPQPERRLADLLALIEAGALSTLTRERAGAVFRRLAAAEARVHRVPKEEVHFHEVGAVDALVDVVGTVLGLELLGVEEVYVSPLPLGGGLVSSSHGVLPVPAPATLELLATAKAPLRPALPNEVELGEMLTPTGAALLTTLGRFERPAFRLAGIGHGLGSRDVPGLPNALRLWLGEKEATPADGLLLFETNIDDMNPEHYGYVMEQLFAAGALDVWFTPIQMKKNRPATMLSVLARTALEGAVADVLLRETSTLGLRVQPVSRHEAQREALRFESSLGEVAVKVKRRGAAILQVAPEYDDCRRIAVERRLSLQEVYRVVEREAWERLGTVP